MAGAGVALRSAPVTATQAWVVVNFHGVGEPARALDPGEHLVWLGEEQFRTILARIAGNTGVRLTVDDGNASDLRVLAPAFINAGLGATFFLTADRLDAPGFLSQGDARALRETGMEVGFHGLSHRPWTGLAPGTLEDDLREGRRRLAHALGEEVSQAACPFGRYSKRVLRALRTAGFRRVYTSDLAAARDGDWLVPRISVRSHDTADSIAAKVDGLLNGRARMARMKMWIKSRL